jgi:hypothetical protein
LLDERKKRAPQDHARINIQEDREVRYWSDELGVDERTLRSVVERVGCSARTVRKHIRSHHGRG